MLEPLEQNAGLGNSPGRVRAGTEKADVQTHQDLLPAEMAETPMWSEGWHHFNCTSSQLCSLRFPVYKHWDFPSLGIQCSSGRKRQYIAVISG